MENLFSYYVLLSVEVCLSQVIILRTNGLLLILIELRKIYIYCEKYHVRFGAVCFEAAKKSYDLSTTIIHKNNESNNKFYRKVAFLMYTEMVNFRPQS